MTPKITQEQRQALEEHNGEPVYVVDSDRQQTYVLLPSDDYHRVRTLLGYSSDNGDWTDEKNNHRCELIDKDIAGTISADERGELAVLERQGAEHFDKVAPPPIEGARRLHQELLDKRGNQQ